MTESVIVMAAPNGSRWSKKDHPALPVTNEEIVQEAVRCHNAGATIVHVHVRDSEGNHVLDVGLYRELLQEISRQAPNLLVQITTEAVGRYTPKEQKNIVCSVMPEMASVALKDMVLNRADEREAAKFYAWAAEVKIHIQHLLYDVEDVRYYRVLRSRGVIPNKPTGALFVLGRYSDKLLADRDDLPPMLKAAGPMVNPWFSCAFGQTEHDCMKLVMQNGGHPRIGFENNFVHANGEVAAGTHKIVAETLETAKSLGLTVCDVDQTRQLLWRS